MIQDVKIRFIQTSKGSTFYCLEDLCWFLQEIGGVKHMGEASWKYQSMMLIELGKQIKNDGYTHVEDLMPMLGLMATFIHHTRVEGMIRHLVRKKWNDGIKLLHAEIDHNEGPLNKKFFEDFFVEIKDINLDQFQNDDMHETY